MLLLVIVGITAGFVAGLDYESNRRDAQALRAARSSEAIFFKALANGRSHASNSIEWRNQATIFYRRWNERLKNANDELLAQCQFPQQPEPAAAPTVQFSAVWVGLYNSAWMPVSATDDDPSGAADQVGEAGAVTPRAVLENVAENARLCADDRQRLDELIDHLNEVEGMQSRHGTAEPTGVGAIALHPLPQSSGYSNNVSGVR